MMHNWIAQFSDKGVYMFVCTECRLKARYHSTRPMYGCKSQYADVDKQRPEPDEEILRQLGHGFTTEEDV
jgi:hypothetical protein